MKFSICIPAYNGEKVIGETTRSILSQSFKNYELIIIDDCSTDNTERVIKSFEDKRIRYYGNKKNLGYSGNLEECCKKATGDILYLMGQDDILGKDALLNTDNAFKISEDIGAVTRPYYWFYDNVDEPVRAKGQLDPKKDVVVRIEDDSQKILSVFHTLDQFSGLAYRRKYMDMPFHRDIFPCHVYPFASIFKKHPIVYLKDYTVAVRIGTSQTRNLSSIYEKSPMKSWKEMFENVFFENNFKEFRDYYIKNFVAINYVGLVQIRNYAKFWHFIREAFYLLKYRPENIFCFQFWFFSLGCLAVPPFVLAPFVDWYKSNVYSRRLEKIKFEYRLS